MVREPYPTPEGMTKEEMEAMMTWQGDWREEENFVHAACGEPAFLHPYTNLIWGCMKCQFTTYSVSVYFLPREEYVPF